MRYYSIQVGKLAEDLSPEGQHSEEDRVHTSRWEKARLYLMAMEEQVLVCKQYTDAVQSKVHGDEIV